MESKVACLKQLADTFDAELTAQARLADRYRSHSEERKEEVEGLSKVFTDMQNMLEESAQKQVEIIKEHNLTVMNQLENISKDITTAVNVDVSVLEKPVSTSTLMAFNHLRQEKEIISGRLDVSQAEKARLQTQLDHQQRLLAETETDLVGSRCPGDLAGD